MQKLVFREWPSSCENQFMGSVSRRGYCAFCKSERVVYRKRHLSLVDVLLCLSSGVLLMLALWQDFDPRVFVFVAVALGAAEIFIVFRWRLSISCPKCGFDPVLYKKNPSLAAAKVKAFLDRRRDDPLTALAPPPKLPVRVKRKAGTRLSIRS